MPLFDAELYLRMLGERQLLDGEEHSHHHSSPLDDPAGALVAAGVITPSRAQRVIDEYDAARRARAGEHGFPHFPSPRRRRAPGRLSPRRTMVIDEEIPLEGGRLLLRDLAIRRGGGRLRFRWRRDTPGSTSGLRMFGGGQFPWGGRAPRIVDDRGRKLSVEAGDGGGSEDQWDGTLELRGPLRSDATWLEVEGTRVKLDPRTAAHEVTIEPLADESPVARWLWRRLAIADMPFGRSADLEPAIAALLAAGALDGDGELVRDVRAVADRMPDHPRHRLGASPTSVRGLPEPWRSLLRRGGRQDGLVRTLVVGALTPVFDGIQIAVELLSCDAEGFEIEFEAAPNVIGDAPLGELPLAWWARDDRGNHHLGFPSGWGGHEAHAEGTLRFWPALDRRAQRIDVLPTADSHRAVISISLEQPP